VRPELVSETIARAWQSGHDLKSATARAFFMLFVVSEVHPFTDGNGRISRLGMNAILEDAGLTRLILPTSFRNDYLTVLEALTINGNAKPYCQFAHKLVDLNSRMPFTSYEESYAHFKKTGALDEPTNSNFSIQNFH
jgi:Fic family protein